MQFGEKAQVWPDDGPTAFRGVFVDEYRTVHITADPILWGSNNVNGNRKQEHGQSMQ